MDRINLSFSLKNIPLPSNNSYLKALIDKVENLLRRMRWKAFFFDNPEEAANNNNFGLSSDCTPPKSTLLTPFENDMFDLIKKTTV